MFKRHDWTILALILILSVIGLFTLLSTNIDIEGNIDLGGVFSRQVTFMLTGLVIYFLVSLANPTYLRYPQILVPVSLVIIAVLLYVVLAGPVINNVRRWIVIGGVQVQPSEFAKIIVIFTTAAIFTIRNHFDDLLLGILSFLPQIPILLLIYLEPHGSMTMITLLIWGILVITYMREQRRNILLFVLMFSATGSSLLLLNGTVGLGILFAIASVTILVLTSYRIEELRKLLIIVTIAGVIVGGALNFSWNDLLKDYQRERIETFFDPEGVDVDQSFNVEQSKVAIGSGGIWGKGFGSGSQSRLQYVPEHQTDFIFATYAEQFGLVGSMILIVLYALLILKVFYMLIR